MYVMKRNVINFYYASAIFEYRYPILYYGVKAFQAFLAVLRL